MLNFSLEVRGKKLFLLILLLILLLAGAGAAFYFFYYQPKYQGENAAPAEEEADEESTPTATLAEYTGQFVQGQLPADWSIVEYQNGAGSTMLVSGVAYVGLTGLEVKNPAGTVVFKLQGVYGIGGLATCENYYQFSDHSAAYLAQIQAINAEEGSPAPTIIDFAATTYQEYDLFALPVRRIDKNIYWDKTVGDAYFQSACGMDARFFTFTTPTFTGDGTVINNYQFTVNDTSPESDLLQMDAILDSLVTL